MHIYMYVPLIKAAWGCICIGMVSWSGVQANELYLGYIDDRIAWGAMSQHDTACFIVLKDLISSRSTSKLLEFHKTLLQSPSSLA